MERNDGIVAFLGVFIVIIACAGAALGGTPLGEQAPSVDGNKIPSLEDLELKTGKLPPKTEHLDENTEQSESVKLEYKYLNNVSFQLTWSDEPAGIGPLGIRQYNAPDHFEMTVTTPYNETKTGDGAEDEVRGSLWLKPFRDLNVSALLRGNFNHFLTGCESTNVWGVFWIVVSYLLKLLDYHNILSENSTASGKIRKKYRIECRMYPREKVHEGLAGLSSLLPSLKVCESRSLLFSFLYGWAA